MVGYWTRRGVGILLAAALVWVMAGCGRGQQPGDGPPAGGSAAATPAAAAPAAAAPSAAAPAERVKVVASFYPLYFLAGAVGGDRVDAVSLVPPGVEPHDWEPTASVVQVLGGAQLFIFNGAGFHPWVDRILAGVENPALAVLDSSRDVALIPAGDEHGPGDEHGQEDEHGHADEQGGAGEHGAAESPGDFDPHIWLDPVLSQQLVQRIAAALTAADPDGAAAYAANAAGLAAELEQLDREYQALAACPRREIIVTHAFFGYPAQRYGLTQVPIVGGLAPDAEPTPRQMARLVELVRERGMPYIFAETLVSDRVAQVIAAEAGARVLVLNPIEGLTDAEQARGQDYFGLMRENLANLKTALECSP